MTKQINVTILGQNYSLVTNETDESQLLQAVEQVNLLMEQINATGKLKGREKIAVLAAVQIAFNSLNQPPSVAPQDNNISATKSAEDNFVSQQLTTQLESLGQKLDQVLNENPELF